MNKKKILIRMILGFALVGICLLVLWLSGIFEPKTDNPVVELNEPIKTESSSSGVTFSQSESMSKALGAISSTRMIATITDLTSIQPHSSWRGSATTGEKEGFDYLQSRLDALTWLTNKGMTREREEFRVFFGTEDHTSSLYLTSGDGLVEIPADSIRGNRDDPEMAIRMDSDGSFTDYASDLITIEGPVTLVPDGEELARLSGSDQSNYILLVDFSLVDTNNNLAYTQAKQLMELDPAAIVVVTQYSNLQGAAHGSFIGDKGGVLQNLGWNRTIPVLFVETENLETMGFNGWEEMGRIDLAKVEWDIDVANPAKSGNLIVHIPGVSSKNPIIVSAHIDSAHSPGALDDGSGSAILLEIATILNEQQIQPPNDLYLVWFGSEEIGLYGSTYFTTTHSELLNRVQANIQVDCLTRPLQGLSTTLLLMFSHTFSGGISSDLFGSHLLSIGEQLEIPSGTMFWPFASDNGSFSAFGIPNVNLIYESMEMSNYPGGVWVAGHLHEPYDTVEQVQVMEDELVDLTRFTLTAAMTPIPQSEFVKHRSDKQAVFIASHTEPPHMTPSGLSNFSLALRRAGYEIKVIPYGTPVTDRELAGVDLVVVLPVIDYPIAGLADGMYDASWTPDGIAAVDKYLREGGRVLVTNSANRLKFYNSILDENEDYLDLNELTREWGVEFTDAGTGSATIPTNETGLVEGIPEIILTPNNAVRFTLRDGQVLAGDKEAAYLAQIQIGKGEVIVCGDLTILGDYDNGTLNPLLVNALVHWE